MRDASAHAQKSRVYGSSAAVVLAADRFVAGDWSDLPDLWSVACYIPGCAVRCFCRSRSVGVPA